MRLVAGVVLVGLAAYRVWRLLFVDEITSSLRGRLHFGETKHPEVADSRLYQFLACPWCSGFWVTGIVALIAYGLGVTSELWWTWLAASVIVGFLGER